MYTKFVLSVLLSKVLDRFQKESQSLIVWSSCFSKEHSFLNWWSCFQLEPVCCKKRQKIVPGQLLVLGIRALWRFWTVPNWSYRIMGITWTHLESDSRISLIPFRTFRGPLLHKPVTGQELFFNVSYSKLTLRHSFNYSSCISLFQTSDSLWDMKWPMDKLNLTSVRKHFMTDKTDFIHGNV